MKWRKISEREIEAVFFNPDKVEQTERSRTNAFKRVGARYIKVTYKEYPAELLIISAVDKSD